MMKEKTYLWASAFWVLLILSFVAPRFVKNSEGGFAAAASGVLVLLGMLLLAALVALILFLRTYRLRDSLPTAAKLAGFIPLPLVALGLIMLVLFLRY